MEILLVERDHLVRDQVKVGLQQFPEYSITCGEGYAAINSLRQDHYTTVFLGISQDEAEEGIQLLDHLRSFDRSTELVIMTGERLARDMSRDKGKYNISAFLQTPVNAMDFFRMMARIRERRMGSDPAAAAQSGNHGRAGVRT